MRKLTRMLLAAALVAGAPFAIAGTFNETGGNGNMMQGADRDGDGRLNRDEYDTMSRNHGATSPPAGEGVPATEHQANVIDKFETRDRDGDGYVTAEELDMKKAN